MKKTFAIMTLILASQTIFAFDLENLKKHAEKLVIQKIDSIGKPFLCTTSDPWNKPFEGRGETMGQANHEALSQCGIFNECTTNMVYSKVK